MAMELGPASGSSIYCTFFHVPVADSGIMKSEPKGSETDNSPKGIFDIDYDLHTSEQIANARQAFLAESNRTIAKIREGGSTISDGSDESAIVVCQELEAFGLSLTQEEYDADWRIITFNGIPMKRCNNEKLKRVLLNQES